MRRARGDDEGVARHNPLLITVELGDATAAQKEQRPPVRVTHVISPPLALDPALDPSDRAALERAQLELWSECQAFLDRTIAVRRSDAVDAIGRRGIELLHRIGI